MTGLQIETPLTDRIHKLRAGERRRAPPSWRTTLLLIAAAVLLASLGARSNAYAATITSSGPLTEIGITGDLNCSLHHVDDSVGQFYNETACGTFLATGGTLYGPSNIPAGTSASPRTGFTAVSQSAVTGSGTAADPYQVVTAVDVTGSGLAIMQTDSYVVGRDSYRTDIEVQNPTSSTQSATLYRAGDCYLQSSDNGFGVVDTPSGSVACRTGFFDGHDYVPSGRLLEWLPLSAGSNFTENDYDAVWAQVGSQMPLPSTCDCATYLDNAGGLSWDIAIPPSDSVTISHLTRVARVAPYPVPLSGSPLELSLVPSFRQCGTGSNPVDSSHAGPPPIDVGSCNPPQPTAAVARVGAEAVASAKATVVPGDQSTGVDEADLAFHVSANDVRSGSPTGADYDPNPNGADLTLVMRWRITDSYNGARQTDPGTTTDLDFSVPVDCVANTDEVGAGCNVTTTADTLVRGAIPEARNTLIQSFRARLMDAGPNGTRGDADDTLFQQQGVFVGDSPPSPPSYETPASATPLTAPLVPSSRQCGTGANPANSTHSVPLSVQSCNPPTPTAAVARVGPQSVGSAMVSTTPGSTAPGDQAEISFEASVTDVRSGTVEGPDYNPNPGLGDPDLTLNARWRVTDTNSGSSQTTPATTTDLDFPVPVECVDTSDATVGAACAVLTSADTLYPGSVPEGKNMVVQVFRLRLNDSGLDGIRGNSNDTLFEQQGLFVP